MFARSAGNVDRLCDRWLGMVFSIFICDLNGGDILCLFCEAIVFGAFSRQRWQLDLLTILRKFN